MARKVTTISCDGSALMKATLTKNMKKTLERLFAANDQTYFITLSTASALELRGLIRIGKRQSTAGGRFPIYLATLTAAGRKWCLRRMAKSANEMLPNPLLTSAARDKIARPGLAATFASA